MKSSPTHPLTLLLMAITHFTLDHTPSLVWKLVILILDVMNFWATRTLEIIRHSPARRLRRSLEKCQTFEEYEPIALKLDRLNGFDVWRQNFASKRYDYKLIHERLLDLRNARLAKDHRRIVSLLRSGLLRNFGGISSKRLYDKSYIGTKILIEEYVTEVMECLRFISEMDVPDNTLEVVSFLQEKLDFFHEARQTMGTTALILQGGTLFGLCHIGVIKSLYAHDLLPNVIAGSSIGAMVGALVCSLSPSELEVHLNNLVDFLPSPKTVDKLGNHIMENVFRRGFSQDIMVFIEYVRQQVGDLTFEEAYLRANRILNIVVYPTDPSFPSLMNYLSTPNVTIISAAYCSMGYNALGRDAQPYIKTEGGKIVPYHIANRECKFMSPYYAKTVGDPSQGADPGSGIVSPYTRLTELFNVNHFVVSLARPYLSPLIGIDFRHSESKWSFIKTIDRLISLEFRHRVEMLDRFGLLFSFLKWAVSDETAPLYAGNQIPIVPEMKTLFRDFKRIFDVNKYDVNIPYWIQVGERSVWPLYPLLQTRCAIEFTLDDYYNMYWRNGGRSDEETSM
ncbi:DEKNAAC104240 [Brettanomyces naardenensis]|uniref:DEKNAAC104240 n=1 Tax=Brettanomyces naardenensis TaxID=13370 RepID=A0A448YQ62_BRENA|nr:DEKNAAC104240 [Brettanomyces naardenensis]